MKKIPFLLCLLACAVVSAIDGDNADQYENQYQNEEADDNESALPPITVNISVSNANDAHANTQTDITQAQTVEKKELEKKKEEQKRALEYARSITVIVRYLAKLRL
jgi:hypothetical protein